MDISLSRREFRLLLDLVYSGNWVINSIRGNDRIVEYDAVLSRMFSYCRNCGFDELLESSDTTVPSAKYIDGGIHEAILDYEDMVFYGILAEELARRDLRDKDVDGLDSDMLSKKIEDYMLEFQKNGVDNIAVNGL